MPTDPGRLPGGSGRIARPGDRIRVVEGEPRADTEGVPTRVVIVATVLLSATAAALSAWLFAWPQEDALATELGFHVGRPYDPVVGLSWLLTGACLAWPRPRNALGWLLVGIGGCQVFDLLAAAYGSLGVYVGNPDWLGARWVAWLSSVLWIPGLLPLANVLIALYPDGRLPGPRWRWPVGACLLATAMLTIAGLTQQDVYHQVAPGPPPFTVEWVPPWASATYVVVALLLLLGGTLTIWVMSVIRLLRMDAPRRQQLAWLFCVIVPMFALVFVPLPEWIFLVVACLIPVAVALGVFRYNLLGIEFVLRRGLTYGTLTVVVVIVYLLVTAAVGTRLNAGALPGVVAAAVVAVGLSPLRERLQRAVDRLVYGERQDPIGALTRLGDQVATTDEQDLLDGVLSSVTRAVRAPGGIVVDQGGELLAVTGVPAPGPSFALTVAGRDVGTLQLAARGRGESYTTADMRLLEVVAHQVAGVVHALDLAQALHAERDLVVTATNAERDRLRRDLHDGLGPSLSGVALGLVAIEDALAVNDTATATRMVSRLRPEVTGAVREVRHIIDDLRPTSLDNTNLDAAVRRQAAVAGFPVDLNMTALPPLRPDVETAAYRITAEALTNVGKHAQASHASVRLRAAEGFLCVEVSDDGRGFPTAPNGSGAGIGITSMRHRAEALGGMLRVVTGGTGTTVTATLPLEPT